MMGEIQKVAFALLRYALCATEISQEVRELITGERLEQVYQLLKMHDLAHLGYDGLVSLKDDKLSKTGVYEQFKRQQQFSVYRYEQKIYEYEQICAAFEDAKIPYLPLKGAVIKAYYPQEWMRTSCDIDILVQADTLGRAVEIIKDKLHYRLEGNHSHEISLFAENGVHLELHYDLLEDYLTAVNAKILSAYWNTATPVREGGYEYAASPDIFYFYHIAHMAKHFEFGGCGVRSFMDLWLMERSIQLDEEKKRDLLEQGHMTLFAQTSSRVAKIWFENEKHDELTQRVEEYVLSGGVYGNMENRITMENIRQKQGKFRYIMRRIFLPYKYIKWQYPILQKHKWLTPLYEVRRWGRLIFKGRLKSSVKEMRTISALEEERKRDLAKLLRDVGLTDK